MSAIEFMKKYIADWDANVAASKGAAEMRPNVVNQYPGLGMSSLWTAAWKRSFPKPVRVTKKQKGIESPERNTG